MIYVALLRGINVGGNRKVEMVRLKTTFESLGFTDVKTYINSGNVIFKTNNDSVPDIVDEVEVGIERDFGFRVHVVVRDLPSIQEIDKIVPKYWTNDTNMKTDVMFLWEEIDNPDIVKKIVIKPEIESVQYVKGTLLWNLDRKNVTKSGMLKIVGTDLYKKMTVRNINTLRRLKILMEDL